MPKVSKYNELADKLGIRPESVRYRIAKGIPLTAPLRFAPGFSADEDAIVLKYASTGRNWSKIAAKELPNRSSRQVYERWRTLNKQGV